MNWIPKAKLSVVNAVQIGRVNNTGSNGPSGSNKPVESSEVSKECSSCRKINCECKESTGPVTAYITDMCQWVVKAVQVRKMNNTDSNGSSGPDADKSKETHTAVTCVDTDMPPPALINPDYVQPTNVFCKDVEYKIVKHLKTYFDDQINYHKTMAKTNKEAMKRIKKLSKDWPNTF